MKRRSVWAQQKCGWKTWSNCEEALLKLIGSYSEEEEIDNFALSLIRPTGRNHIWGSLGYSAVAKNFLAMRGNLP